MMRASSILGIVAAAALLAACARRQEPEQPAPEPAPPPQREAPPPPPPPARNDDAERLAREAEERARALRADLTSPIHFDFDRADVRAGTDQTILDRKAAVLNANPSVRLRISGHADERGSDEYNLALGNRRGASAKRYLAGKGVADARLEVVSYGEERPANPGHDEAAWAENRRDEFELTAGGDNLNAP